jgi:hypothetical protein
LLSADGAQVARRPALTYHDPDNNWRRLFSRVRSIDKGRVELALLNLSLTRLLDACSDTSRRSAKGLWVLPLDFPFARTGILLLLLFIGLGTRLSRAMLLFLLLCCVLASAALSLARALSLSLTHTHKQSHTHKQRPRAASLLTVLGASLLTLSPSSLGTSARAISIS